jgi:hypothetical protein
LTPTVMRTMTTRSLRECGRDTLYQHANTIQALQEAVVMLEHMTQAYTMLVPEQTHNILTRLRTWRNICDKALLEIEANVRRDKNRGGMTR